METRNQIKNILTDYSKDVIESINNSNFDTLAEIARRFSTTVADLASRNKIANPNRIYVGQVLDLGLCDR